MKKTATFNMMSDKIMTEAEAAYMAGFLDGEGTITLIKTAWKRNRTGFQYQPYVSLANTCLSVLEAIRAMCGNGRIQATTHPRNPLHKIGYALRFSSNQIRHILPQLVPYLFVKKRQAELLIEYLGEWRKGLHITDESYARGEDFRQRLGALNRKGEEPDVVQAQWDAIRPSRLGNNQHLKLIQ